ncbi:MAG: hypothetical protein JNK78_04400 [Planctomycetes bacterium]|nr:hypothetical protein [Planctomycetota bacterium]
MNEAPRGTYVSGKPSPSVSTTNETGLTQQREKDMFDYLTRVGDFLQRSGVGTRAETIAVLESFQRQSRTLR